MTGFIQKKIVTEKSLPEILREERLKLGWSIEDLEEKTQISVRYLEALETGNYQDLPGEVYLNQFLKKLAKFFRLSDKVLLEIYQKEKRIQPPLLVLSSKPQNKLSAHFKPMASSFYLSRGVAGLLILLLLGYLGFEARNIFTPPKLEIVSPTDQALIPGSSVEISGLTSPLSELTINNETLIPEEDGDFTKKVELNPGLNVFIISAVKKHSSAKTVTLSVFRQEVLSLGQK